MPAGWLKSALVPTPFTEPLWVPPFAAPPPPATVVTVPSPASIERILLLSASHTKTVSPTELTSRP
jgi:hypothetical protein